MIQFATATSIGRTNTWLDPTLAFEIAGHGKQDGTTPGVGEFRNYWTYGDTVSATNPYIYVGGGAGLNTIVLEYFDGTTYYDTATFSPTADVDFTWGVRWIPGSTQLVLLINGAVHDTLTVDIRTVPFVEKNEMCGSGFAGYGVGFLREWQRNLTNPQAVIEGKTLRAAVTTNLLADSPLEVPTDLTDAFGHDWTPNGTTTTTTPFNTTCAKAAVILAAQLPYAQLQQIAGATELWATYTTALTDTELRLAAAVNYPETSIYEWITGSCGAQTVLTTETAPVVHNLNVDPSTQYWLRSASWSVGVVGVAWYLALYDNVIPSETVANPMTWYPDLSSGTVVTLAASWSGSGTKVELISAAPEDLLLCQILTIPTAVGFGNTYEGQIDLWLGPGGSETPLGSVSFHQRGIAGDGFGPATIELNVPLQIPSGSRVSASGESDKSGTKQHYVSLGVIPATVTGAITSTASVLKVAPDKATGTNLVPGDLVGGPGAWVEFIASAGGDVNVEGFCVSWPDYMGRCPFRIELGIGGVGAEVAVDMLGGAGSDTAIADEGFPEWVKTAVSASGLIPMGSRVSARIRVWKSTTDANLNPWRVHLVYFES